MHWLNILFIVCPILGFSQNGKASLGLELGFNKSYSKLYYKPNLHGQLRNPIDPNNIGPYHIKDKHNGCFFSAQYKSNINKLYYLTGIRFCNKKFDFVQDQFLDSVIGSIFMGYNFSYIELPLLARFYNKQSNNSGVSIYGGLSINYMLTQLRGKGNSFYWSSFDNPPKSEFIPPIFGPSYKENHINAWPKIALSIYAEYRNDFYLGKNNAITFGYTKDLMPAMQQQYRMSINNRIYEALYYPVFGYAYMAYKYQLLAPKFLKKK